MLGCRATWCLAGVLGRGNVALRRERWIDECGAERRGRKGRRALRIDGEVVGFVLERGRGRG